MRFTDEQIALVCHTAIMGLQEVLGDSHPSEPFTVSPQQVKDRIIHGVQRARRGATPREMHEEWCQYLFSRGWSYGPKRDEQARTHPNLLDYDDLPAGQRVKDELFLDVVMRLAVQT